MSGIRSVSALVAAGAITVGISTGTAWAGGPGGVVEDYDGMNLEEMSVAIGTGVFEYDLVGFIAPGATNEEAEANVVAQCEAAGGMFCTSDIATNDDNCIVSVADPVNFVVVGGAGETVEGAVQNAVQEAAANNMPVSVPDIEIVLADCWED